MELAREGARLVITARREDRLQEVSDAIQKIGGEVWPAGDLVRKHPADMRVPQAS